MTDWDQMDVDESKTEEPRLTHVPEPRPPAAGPDGGRSGALWAVAALVLLAALALGAYFLLWRRPAEKPEPATTPVEMLPPAPAPPAPPPPPAIEIPPLDASDALVRELVAGLSAHPKLAAWLAGEDLVRRFVVAVDNVAEGVSPRGRLLALAPEGAFRVEEEAGRTVIDPASYRRYDIVATAFTSLDTAGTAELYHEIQPLLDEAYAELGYPGRDFDTTLGRAIEKLLAVPVVEGPVEVVAGVESYDYADPSLENLTPAQKHLLRMGPANVRRVQAKLRELARALDL